MFMFVSFWKLTSAGFHGRIDFALTTVTVGCFIDSRGPCQSLVESSTRWDGQ